MVDTPGAATGMMIIIVQLQMDPVVSADHCSPWRQPQAQAEKPAR